MINRRFIRILSATAIASICAAAIPALAQDSQIAPPERTAGASSVETPAPSLFAQSVGKRVTIHLDGGSVVAGTLTAENGRFLTIKSGTARMFFVNVEKIAYVEAEQ